MIQGKQQDDSDAAVIGCGCFCAAGQTLPETMAALFAKRRGNISFEHVVAGHAVRYPLFSIPDAFAPPGYLDAPECERCGRLAIAAAGEAIRDAGIPADELKKNRVGVCIGTTVGSAMNNEAFYREFRQGANPDVRPIQNFLAANPSAMVARQYGFSGPCATVVNACSSGTVAIGEAAEWIRQGVCDVALAGGADMLCRVVYNGFIALKISDAEPCRPFDRDRRGLNLGEGAGLLMLVSERLMRAHGIQPRAWIRGYGNTCDAYHPSAPHPQADGLAAAFTIAMKEAGIGPTDIAFINAHGTATPENDAAEGCLFSTRLKGIPFCSTKGYTGHTLGAAGGIEATITVACLEAGKIPANVGLNAPDPAWDSVPVLETTAISGRYAISDSAAFGGNNGVLVFEKGVR